MRYLGLPIKLHTNIKDALARHMSKFILFKEKSNPFQPTLTQKVLILGQSLQNQTKVAALILNN